MRKKKPVSSLKDIVLNLSLLLVGLFLLSFLLNHFNLVGPVRMESWGEEAEVSFTKEGVLKKNVPLYNSLLNFGLSNDEVYKITQTLNKVFDLKRCQPNDKYLLGFAADSTLLSLEYQNGFEKRFIVEKMDTIWVARSLPFKFNCIVKYLEGEIKSSLWESMYDKCQNPELIVSLTDIFAWEIDFLNEPRNGDRFRLAFEEYWYEEKFVRYGDIIAAEYTFSKNNDRHIAFLYEDPIGHKDYYDSLGHSLRKALLKSPLNYRRISSGFSYRRLHPIFKVYRPHLGVDYAAPVGTPIVAAGDGVVSFAGWKKGFGRYVVIRHTNGYVTSYGHLLRYGKGIKKGTKIKQKDIIGYVGNSGHSTGPHLDYRVKVNGKYINPLRMSLPSAAPVKKKYWDDFCENRDKLISAMETLSQACIPSTSSQEIDSIETTQ